jgi:hypothetical protein
MAKLRNREQLNKNYNVTSLKKKEKKQKTAQNDAEDPSDREQSNQNQNLNVSALRKGGKKQKIIQNDAEEDNENLEAQSDLDYIMEQNSRSNYQKKNFLNDLESDEEYEENSSEENQYVNPFVGSNNTRNYDQFANEKNNGKNIENQYSNFNDEVNNVLEDLDMEIAMAVRQAKFASNDNDLQICKKHLQLLLEKRKISSLALKSNMENIQINSSVVKDSVVKDSENHKMYNRLDKINSNIEKFKADETDPASHLKKIKFAYLSADLTLTPNLLLRALLNSINHDSDAAGRFVKLIYDNPIVNTTISDISKSFILKFPHKSRDELSDQFWSLRYNENSGVSILSYLTKFDNLASNLQFSLDESITLDFLKRSIPEWVQSKIKNLNFNDNWDNEQSKVMNFERLSDAIQSVYNNFKQIHGRKHVTINKEKDSKENKDNKESYVVKEANQSHVYKDHKDFKELNVNKSKSLWCNFCNRANHSEDMCFIKYPELKKPFNNNNPRPIRH